MVKEMKEIDIQIENTELSNLGIDQEDSYTTLYFNESQFIGYWISNTGSSLTFYIGSQCFICDNSKRNKSLFDSILLYGK